jgi:hypothetical protein
MVGQLMSEAAASELKLLVPPVAVLDAKNQPNFVMGTLPYLLTAYFLQL